MILDVEATRSIRQAEVGSVRTMIDRVNDTFGIEPERLIADTAYGTGVMLDWLDQQRDIAPHILVFHCPSGDCEAICREGQVSPEGRDIRTRRLRL